MHAYAAIYSKDADYVSRAGMLLNGRTEKLHTKAFAASVLLLSTQSHTSDDNACSWQGSRRLPRLRRAHHSLTADMQRLMIINLLGDSTAQAIIREQA